MDIFGLILTELASDTRAIFTEYGVAIVGFILSVATGIFGIKFGKRAIFWVLGKIMSGVFGGGKGRRGRK